MKTFGDYGYQALRKSFHRVTKVEAAVLQDQDPEPLHQMRVGMRRLRTVLQVFEPAIALPKAVSDKRIRTPAQTLGSVRDLDVLRLELLNRHRPNLPTAEQRRLDGVLQKLENQRRRQFKQLEKVLGSGRYQGLKQSCQAWLADPTYTSVADLPILAVVPDLLLPLLSQLLLHPGWGVGANGAIDAEGAGHPQAEQLHDLRKQIKRVRYQMELFIDFYGVAYGQQLEEFQQLQELLGQMQDGLVLRQVLSQTLKLKLRQELPTLAQRLEQQQQECWQQWQPYRHRYLDFGFRQSLRQQFLLLDGPDSQPAPQAVDHQPNVLLQRLG